MQRKKGISLIVLVITIIVMIILAATVIISLNNAGIIGNLNEAVFKQNVKNYIVELNLYVGEELIADHTLDMGTINSTDATIQTMIESMRDEDITKFAVVGGELVYKGTSATEEMWCQEIGVASINEYNSSAGVNAPKLVEGMIPVKYENGKWIKADEANTNSSWYKYDTETKQWANVVTVSETNRETYMEAAAGTEIAMADITTMFVWIPRYAYSINEGYYKTSDTLSETATASNQKIDVSFLVGTSNSSLEGTTYTSYGTDYDASEISAGKATPKIVHPAFTFGEKELTGIWVAKFEASGYIPGVTTAGSNATYAGNMPADSATLQTITENTYVTVIPSVPSWRSITIGDAQTQSMKMKNNNDAYGFVASELDTHLIKNNEWGAVAYLSASEYGAIPVINTKGSYSSALAHYYDFMTGYQGNSNTYEVGTTASTTHNIYGIYDMNGGSWERVAAYLNNGNNSLSTYAGTYFDKNNGNALKTEYAKYWDSYEVSSEEKNNAITVTDLGDGLTTVTQGQLWTLTKTINGSVKDTIAWNEARHRITKATYDNMASHKGDVMYETTGSHAYCGVIDTSGIMQWNWLLEPTSTAVGYGRSWNNDSVTNRARVLSVRRSWWQLLRWYLCRCVLRDFPRWPFLQRQRFPSGVCRTLIRQVCYLL